MCMYVCMCMHTHKHTHTHTTYTTYTTHTHAHTRTTRTTRTTHTTQTHTHTNRQHEAPLRTHNHVLSQLSHEQQTNQTRPLSSDGRHSIGRARVAHGSLRPPAHPPSMEQDPHPIHLPRPHPLQSAPSDLRRDTKAKEGNPGLFPKHDTHPI